MRITPLEGTVTVNEAPEVGPSAVAMVVNVAEEPRPKTENVV